jgi:hypothetical protein
MASNNQGAKAVRAARNNSQEFTNKKVYPACTDCLKTPPVRAIILYPNLGTPLMIPPDEKYLNFFIAAENSSKEYFEVIKNTTNNFPAPARSGFRYVDKHLRIHAISNKKIKENTDEGRLWNDGKLCGNAFDNVQVWCIGRLSSGTITDIDGNIFANIRERTLEQYGKISAAHTDPNDPAAENVPLVWVYQVRIILASIPNLPKAGVVASLAWMVALPNTYKKQATLNEMNDWEYQDKLIYDFLESQKKNPKKSHFPELYEFSLSKGAVSSILPEQIKKASHRLKAWHPFMIGVKKKLVIGHLSDVHINVRQFAMAKSQAQVIDGVSIKLGSRVNITFLALKNLFDEMKAAGADLLFITGDLLDFNRNLDPVAVSQDGVDQWEKFNVQKNINNPHLYKRGLDDMLMYSLLRYSYEQLKLPVFLTTGNHEAYDIPYGVSPRMNKKTKTTGGFEMVGITGSSESSAAEKARSSVNVDPAHLPEEYVLLKEAIKEFKSIPGKMDGNVYAQEKANGGIAADHNLTIYEACLIYGPSYAQVLTSENFTPDNYDWFFTMFTPLADYVAVYNQQKMIGLDWGASENYINLQSFIDTHDFQGRGMLPRASESISEKQKLLLESAFGSKKVKTTLLFSHFTLINFGMSIPFKKGDKQNVVEHCIGDFSLFNFGTCEKHQSWLYDICVNNNLQYHFSGHSHRSGVYMVRKEKREVKLPTNLFADTTPLVDQESKKILCKVTGFDPGIEPDHKDNRVSAETKLIVSSCGGPIGVQNQNNELFEYNLQLPSGTLLNEDTTPPIRLVKVDPVKLPSAKPRLCVALDYLWVIWSHDNRKAEEPILFINSDQAAGKISTGIPPYFLVRLGGEVRALNCIGEICFYVHVIIGNAAQFIKIAMRIVTNYENSHHTHELRFEDENSRDILNSIISKPNTLKLTQVFCEVSLKRPVGFAVQHFSWQDKWYFPVQLDKVKSTWWNLLRPVSAFGEAPNWTWLGRAYPQKYSVPKRGRDGS